MSEPSETSPTAEGSERVRPGEWMHHHQVKSLPPIPADQPSVLIVRQDEQGKPPAGSVVRTAADVTIREFDGGEDLSFAMISRSEHWPVDDEGKPLPGVIELTYPPKVAGTDLVYDVDLKRMQGKARPFFCDLAGDQPRVFAITPVQVESFRSTVHVDTTKRCDLLVLNVQIRDAAGSTIRGQFPLEFALRGPDDRKHSFTILTQSDGTLYTSVPFVQSALGKWHCTVTCLVGGVVNHAEFTLS